MVKSNATETKKTISRREALLKIQNGKTVICQTRKEEFYELSTMEDLEKVVNFEQKGLYNYLHFYEKN